MKRIEQIDWLKGFCIILVVIGHFYSYQFTELNTHYLYNLIYTFHMPLFMFISGFLSNPLDTKKLIKKLSYFLCPVLFVGIPMSIVFHHTSIDSFWLKPLKYGYWYLWTLSFFYIFMRLKKTVDDHFSHSEKSIDFIFFTSILISAYLFKMSIPKQIGDIISIDQFCTYWPFFYGGYVIKKYSLYTYITQSNALFSFCFISYLPFIYLYFHGCSIKFIVGSCAIVSLIYLFNRLDNQKISDQLSYLGKNTLDIYIFHHLFIEAINVKDICAWISETSNILFEIVFLLIISIFISYCSALWGKLLKQSKFVENIVYGKFIDYFIK